MDDSRGIAVAGNKLYAIVINTTTASKKVTANPILSPECCGRQKTKMFSKAMKTVGSIRVIKRNRGRRVNISVYLTVGV